MLVRLLVSALFLVVAACSSPSEAPVRTVVERYPEATTKPAKTPPTLASLSPASGEAGDLITLRGSRLGDAQGASLVLVGGVPAQISTWADTQVTIYVPAGLIAGALDVVAVVEGKASNALALTVTVPPAPPGGDAGFPAYARLLGRVDVYGRYTQAGVVVSVAGTSLTTATDVNGIYFIDQIPPGKYDVTFTVPGGLHEPVTLPSMEFVAGVVERPSAVPLYRGFALARGLTRWVELLYPSAAGAYIMKDDAGWVWGVRVPDANAVRFDYPFGGDFRYEFTPELSYILYSGCSPWYYCNQFEYAGLDWVPHTVATDGAEIVPLNETTLLILFSPLLGEGLYDLANGAFTPLANGVVSVRGNQDYLLVQSGLGEMYSMRLTDQAVTPLDTGVAWMELTEQGGVLYAKSSPGELLYIPAAGGVTYATGVTAASVFRFSPTGKSAIVEDGLGNRIALSVTGGAAPVAITGTTYSFSFQQGSDYFYFYNVYGTFMASALNGSTRFLGWAGQVQKWGAAGYFFQGDGGTLYRMTTLESAPEFVTAPVAEAYPITDTHFVYWNWDGQVRSMPMTGGPSVLLATGITSPYPLETKDGIMLFFGGGATTQTLYRVPITGGPLQALAVNYTGYAINPAGTRVAYRTPSGQLYARTASGGPPAWVDDSVANFSFLGDDELQYAYSYTLGTTPLMVKRLTDGAVDRLAPPFVELFSAYFLGPIEVKSGAHYEHVETRLYRRP